VVFSVLSGKSEISPLCAPWKKRFGYWKNQRDPFWKKSFRYPCQRSRLSSTRHYRLSPFTSPTNLFAVNRDLPATESVRNVPRLQFYLKLKRTSPAHSRHDAIVNVLRILRTATSCTLLFYFQIVKCLTRDSYKLTLSKVVAICIWEYLLTAEKLKLLRA